MRSLGLQKFKAYKAPMTAFIAYREDTKQDPRILLLVLPTESLGKHGKHGHLKPKPFFSGRALCQLQLFANVTRMG